VSVHTCYDHLIYRITRVLEVYLELEFCATDRVDFYLIFNKFELSRTLPFSNELHVARDLLSFKLGIQICSSNLGIWYFNRTSTNLGHRILTVNKCLFAEDKRIILQRLHWPQLRGRNIRDMLTPYRLRDLGVFRTLWGLEFRGIQFITSCHSQKCFKHRTDLSIIRIDKHPRYPNRCYDRGDTTEVT